MDCKCVSLKNICCGEEEELKMCLLRLPDELLLMIFSHLSVIDQERASETCRRLKAISLDRRLYRIANLSAQFSCTKEMFHRLMKPRYHDIVHLDLTSCYWLTSSDIYKYVIKMEQLESLYAVDTQLNVYHITQLAQKLQRLRRLSFNWSSEPLEDISPNPLLRLQFLYIYVTKWGLYFSSLLSWLEGCINLRELWILSYGSEGDGYFPVYRNYNFSFPALETLVIDVVDATSYIFPFLRQIVAGAVSTTSLRCLWLGFHDPYAKGSPSEDQLTNVEYLCPYPPLMNVSSQNLKSACPYTIVNLTKSEYPLLNSLHLCLTGNMVHGEFEQEVLDNLESFMCSLPCSSSYMTDVIKLISSNNRLQKVILKYYHGHAAVSDQRTQIDEFLLLVTRCCPQIQELVIKGCPSCVLKCNLSIENLSDIWKLVNLRKLTLQYIHIQDAKFLTKITSNCENLRSISLNSLGLQGHCVYLPDICTALKYCKSLKDFRIEHSNLGKIDQLLEHLKLCPSLERVLIYSERNRIKPSHGCILDLIAKASKLVFFMCLMPSITQQQEKVINKIVKDRFLKERPALIVKVAQQLDDSNIAVGVVHFAAMLNKQPELGPAESSIHVTGLQ